jgi:hypothetical protein
MHVSRTGFVLAALAVLVTAPTAAAQIVPQPRDVFDRRSRQEVDADTVEVRQFDDGRFWTLDDPPFEYLESRYGLEVEPRWIERVRGAALRVNGCSGSLVSPHGLAMTSLTCVQSAVARLSDAGEVFEAGYVASSVGDARRLPGLSVDRAVRTEAVTASVRAATRKAQTPAERTAARSAAVDSIRQALRSQAGSDAHVVRVHQRAGGEHVATVYRRYRDVRLAFAPEKAVAAPGGSAGRFTYPRHAFDVALLRVYGPDGAPLETDRYVEWSTQGSRPGEPVFTVASPRPTRRAATADQLRFERDVEGPARARIAQARADAIDDYLASASGGDPRWRALRDSLSDAAKRYDGRVRALRDAYVMSRVRRSDRRLARAVARDSALRAMAAGVADSLSALQNEKRALADAYRAFHDLAGSPAASATLRRALAVRSAGAEPEVAARRVAKVASQPAGLDRRLLAARLSAVRTALSAGEEAGADTLAGAPAEDRAREVVAASVLSDSASAVRRARSGDLPSDDPALALVDAFFERYRAFRSAWAGLSQREAALERTLRSARAALRGSDAPPDAAGDLRLADGTVRGYEYNGTVAAPFTTVYGLYEQHHAYGERGAWGLPERWADRPSDLERSTPLTVAASTDHAAGSNGGVLFNRSLQAVGLVFDTNVEHLAGAYLFRPGGMRSVAVDVRALVEALDDVYDADRLVLEATGRSFVETEAAADEYQ